MLLLLLSCSAPAVTSDKTTGDTGFVAGDTADSAAETGTSAYDDDGDGFSEDDGDCDDTNPAAHPHAEEKYYDNVDEDCAGGDDNDADRDGHASSTHGGDDCDDTDATIYPGATDVYYDGVDQDCVGGDANDADGDGWPSPADCADDDGSINPDAVEVCDGLNDENCDGEVDEDSAVLGEEACPAPDCLILHSERPDLGDGTYWIDVGMGAEAMVCDMTRDDGGWTLVANFVWPGNTAGVAGWTSGARVGGTTTDRSRSFKLSDAEINALVALRYRARGTATTCLQGACTVDTTLYWDAACVYDSGHSSTGACTAAFQTYDLQDWTELSNPCSWHYGLTSCECGVTSEFGTSHEGDHVFAGIVGTYTHAYDGRDGENPNVEVWVK